MTGGGVNLAEIDPKTMESRKHKGLFLCGEMLDAFGPIGGYNFLWAWATGRAAGIGASRMICLCKTMSMTTRILIVEDHADSAEFLRLLLEPEGYVVKTAATAQHAREEVAASKPDIILMDLMLPDVEGLDLLRELRAMSPESQVIVVSGHGSIIGRCRSDGERRAQLHRKADQSERVDGAAAQSGRKARARPPRTAGCAPSSTRAPPTPASSGAASQCASSIN